MWKVLLAIINRFLIIKNKSLNNCAFKLHQCKDDLENNHMHKKEKCTEILKVKYELEERIKMLEKKSGVENEVFE